MTKNLAVGILSLALLMPGISHAARDYGRNPLDFVGEVYLTVKYGEVTYALEVPESGSEIRTLGFVFGSGISETWAMEFEYTTTVSVDDDYKLRLSDTLTLSGSSAEVNSLGVFAVARTPGDLYLKGRLGYTRTEQIFSDSLGVDWGGSKNVYGVAYGFSLGYKFTKGGALELEYMVYPTREDLTFDTTPVGGSVFEDDLEVDFVSLNYVMSFQ